MFHFPLLDQTGIVRHCFTTRYGGVSEGMFSSLNLSFSTWGCEQNLWKKIIGSMAEALGVSYEQSSCAVQTRLIQQMFVLVTEEDAGTGVICPKRLYGCRRPDHKYFWDYTW